MELRRPLRQNTWAHAPALQRPHLGPPLSSMHSWRIRPAGLLGAIPNPRLAPEGPLPRGLATQRWGLGTPEPRQRTHPASPPPPEPLGAPLVIQGGRMGRALQAPATFVGHPPRNAWAHASARQRPHLGPPLHHRTAGGSGLPGFWGITLTLGRPPWGPSQGAWHRKAGDWGPPSPSVALTLLSRHHLGR